MRLSYLGVIALAFCASPALAQDCAAQDPSTRDLSRAADALSNPAVQDTVAAVVDQFAAALLDTRVGPLARYADPRDHVRAEDTLGQVIERRDPDFAQKLHEQTHDLVRGAGQAAGDAAVMTAELRRTTERLRRMLAATRGALAQR